MNFLQIKEQVASFMGSTAASTTRYAPADFIINGIDLLSLSVNNARRTFERLHDFSYSQADVTLSIAATGSSILDARTFDDKDVSIKKVTAVLLPITNGYIPIEFSTNDNYLNRIRNQTGRQAYDPTATMDDIGINITSPLAIQQGQTIYVFQTPAPTFPIAAYLSVVRFLPDYVTDGDHDFISDIGPEALLWQSAVELNRLTKNFGVQPAEGNVPDPQDLAQMAFESLVTWDLSLNDGTGTPDQPMPQLSRPSQTTNQKAP